MSELKEGIKLSRKEFDILNDCDHLALFAVETDRFLATLEDEEILDFDFLGHFCHLIDRLYIKFDYVLVTQEDEFYGFRDNKYKLLYRVKGVFEKAKGLN